MRSLRLFFIFVFLIFLLGFIFGTGEIEESVSLEYTPGESGSFSLLENIFTTFGSIFGLDDSEYGAQGAKLFVDTESGKNFLNVAGEDSFVKLGDDTYENMGSDSFFEIDNEGQLVGAELLAKGDASWNIPGFGSYDIQDGDKLTLVNGEVRIDSQSGVFNWNDENFELLGDFLSMKQETDGNYFFTGNLKTDIYDFTNLGEDPAQFILGEDNRVIEIWKGTKAKLYGVDLDVYRNVKISYDEDFDVSNFKGSDYFNFGSNKINAGGDGWGFKLEENNKVFQDMKFTKEVPGVGTKSRELNFKLNGADIEIEKSSVQKKDYNLVWNDKIGYMQAIPQYEEDISFNIKGEGYYEIENGRANILIERKPIERDWSTYKLIYPEGSNIYINSDYNKLSYSYDFNLEHEGTKYSLQNNIFRDAQGNKLNNLNFPWENAALNFKNFNDEEFETLAQEIKEIRGQDTIYKGDPSFDTFLKGPYGEAILKDIYEGAYRANENNLGVEVSPLEIFVFLEKEGAGFKDAKYRIPFFQRYENPSKEFLGMEMGLTNTPSVDTLKSKNLIPQDLEVKPSDSWKNLMGMYSPELNVEKAKYYFPATFANTLSYFEKDCKELYGEEKFNSLSNEEKMYWVTYYFNKGVGAGRNDFKEKGFDIYGKIPDEAVRGDTHFNSRVRADFYVVLEKMGLFGYP